VTDRDGEQVERANGSGLQPVVGELLLQILAGRGMSAATVAIVV